MRRKFLCLSLIAILFMSIFTIPTSAVDPVKFKRVKTYTDDIFPDMHPSSWYFPGVKASYEFGLINGKKQNMFMPEDNITIAETITIAARLYDIFTHGKETIIQSGSKWYDAYIKYALEEKIITSEYPNYNRIATRSEFAIILAKALPEYKLEPMNIVADGSIPDITPDMACFESVYKLYQAGVLTGSDAAKNFMPFTYIERKEVATVISRMADTEMRQNFTLKNPVSPVFYWVYGTKEYHNSKYCSVIYDNEISSGTLRDAAGDNIFVPCYKCIK